MSSPHTAWTHLNWLETLGAIEPLVGDGPLDVALCPETHGLRVMFDGVQTTLHGLNTLEANSLVASGSAAFTSPAVSALLSRSLTEPDVTVRLSDHPERLEVQHLDEVLPWTHLPVDFPEEHLTLSPAQRRSLKAVHHSAVRQIVRASGQLALARQQLGSHSMLALTLIVVTLLVTAPSGRMILGLGAALATLRLLNLYTQRNAAQRQLKKTEDNVMRGLTLQGFEP